MARLAVLLLALSLVHSAQAQPVQPTPAAKARPAVKKPASPEGTLAPPSASGPCIGVFPLLGDRFQVKKIGITVFGNEFKEIAVDNWGLDDLVVERVRAVVARASRSEGYPMPRMPSSVTRRESGFSKTTTRRCRLSFNRLPGRPTASATWSLQGPSLNMSEINPFLASASSIAAARSAASLKSMRSFASMSTTAAPSQYSRVVPDRLMETTS